MPEPGSKADEAVRDAREVVGHEAMVDIAFENLRLRWRPAPKLNRAEWRSLFSEPEAAIRASERAKVEALLEAADWSDYWQDYENEMSERGRVISPEMAFGMAWERFRDRVMSALDAVRAGRAS